MLAEVIFLPSETAPDLYLLLCMPEDTCSDPGLPKVCVGTAGLAEAMGVAIHVRPSSLFHLLKSQVFHSHVELHALETHGA